jgi:hypothetical protein
MRELFFLWVVTSTGLPSMSTNQHFETYASCQTEVLRLERKYYYDRAPHKTAKSGAQYYMDCLTVNEVQRRLNETMLEKVL